MDLEFHAQAVPEPVTILGRKLKPFSLGHQLLLERIESPLISGAPASFPDLFVAVSICSRGFDDAVRWLDGGSRLHLRWWGFKVWLGIKLGSANLVRATVMFLNYLANGSKFPTLLLEEGGKHKRVELPLVALLLAFLVRHGASLSEAYATPYGLALWLYCAHSAAEGRAEIVGSEWKREVESMQVTPQSEIDRMIAIHEKLTRRN